MHLSINFFFLNFRIHGDQSTARVNRTQLVESSTSREGSFAPRPPYPLLIQQLDRNLHHPRFLLNVNSPDPCSPSTRHHPYHLQSLVSYKTRTFWDLDVRLPEQTSTDPWTHLDVPPLYPSIRPVVHRELCMLASCNSSPQKLRRMTMRTC